MKIAINVQFLNKPNTGTGQYLINLLKVLLEIDKDNEYILYLDDKTDFDFSNSLSKVKIKIVKVPFYTRDDLIRKTLWEKFVFPNAVKKDKVDLVWSPYFSVSRFRDIQHIMTIHDVIYRIFPQYIPNIRWKIYYKLAENAARRADQILTISECSKNDIVKFLGIREEKIKTVYLGRPKIPLIPPLRNGESGDSPFEKGGRPASVKTTAGEGILENKKYILYLGGFDYRKNVVTLLQAYKKFSESHLDIYLAIVGKLPEYSNSLVPDLKGVVSELGLNEKVIFPGYISDEDLPIYFKNAEVFVFPTLYEGFGLPVLEAMSYSCPVVSSHNSSIPEVAGDAAILVDPNNIEDVTNAICKVVDNKVLRQTMIQKGLENAQIFSWGKCARETLEVFRRQ